MMKKKSRNTILQTKEILVKENNSSINRIIIFHVKNSVQSYKSEITIQKL